MYGFKEQVQEAFTLLNKRKYDDKAQVHIIQHEDYVKLVDIIRGFQGLENLKDNKQRYAVEIEMKNKILEKLT